MNRLGRNICRTASVVALSAGIGCGVEGAQAKVEATQAVFSDPNFHATMKESFLGSGEVAYAPSDTVASADRRGRILLLSGAALGLSGVGGFVFAAYAARRHDREAKPEDVSGQPETA